MTSCFLNVEREHYTIIFLIYVHTFIFKAKIVTVIQSLDNILLLVGFEQPGINIFSYVIPGMNIFSYVIPGMNIF